MFSMVDPINEKYGWFMLSFSHIVKNILALKLFEYSSELLS